MEYENNQQDSSLEQAEQLYKHVRELAEFKYDSELRREDSLIQQSSNMQTAFSFSTAALFMIAPIVIEYRGSLSVVFFLVAFSSITASLLLCLAFASFAQKRYAHEAFPDIEEIENAFKGKVDFVIEGSLTEPSETTILDCTSGEIELVRLGKGPIDLFIAIR